MTFSKKKNIVIIGGSGFIGSNFLSLKDYYFKLNYKFIFPSHKELDILSVDQIKKIVNQYHPEVVINFAAYRNATLAEKQRGDTTGSVWKTNVVGVENLSKVCKKHNIFFIHISTDMVFSGYEDNPGPYDEDEMQEANQKNLSWYGWTKAKAENILKTNRKTAIIRIGNVTQPIYDPRLDYIGKILYLFDHDKIYPLFKDQYLTLSYIPSILEAIEVLIKTKRRGIFHIASKNIFTPHKLGEYLIEKARGQVSILKSISIDGYLKNAPNRYPKYGGLLANRTAHILGIKLLDWEEIVDLFIDKTKKLW